MNRTMVVDLAEAVGGKTVNTGETALGVLSGTK